MFRLLILGVSIILRFGISLAANTPKYEKLTYISSGSCQIEGKLWIPDSKCSSDILVIDVRPCLEMTFSPDSSKTERYDIYLRQKMIEKGMFYFEFAGRKDSIWKFDRKYPVSTMYTKAEDLENAIKYVKSRDDVKIRKVFLIGMSEGGMTSVIVASKINVNGIILISTPAVSGSEFTKYQGLCQDSAFMETFGKHDEVFDFLNNISSLKRHKYEKSYMGYQEFKEETLGPMEEIIRIYNNYDTIAYYVIKHIRNKWENEDSITKERHKNFFSYCNAHRCFQYIQPQQIALRKWDPKMYYSKINCPVLSIFGDKDRNVEYSSSRNNMQKLLLLGGNDKYTSVVLKGYDHDLQDKRQIDKVSLNKIVDWILSH